MNEQEEMRKALVNKFYELGNGVKLSSESAQDVISAARTMESIYRILFIDEYLMKLKKRNEF